MPVDLTWDDVVQWDQDEDDETELNTEEGSSDREQVDEGSSQISSCRPLHEMRVDIPVHQTIRTRCIPPDQLEHQSGNYQRAAINDDRDLLLWVLTNERRREGDKHNTQQQQQVEPEQSAIRPFDIVEGVVMSDPVDADNHETQHVDQQFGPELEQFGYQFV